MGINLELALTNSRGLGRALFFTGLEFPAVVAPALLEQPILTAQALYYVEQLEAVVRTRFESEDHMPPGRSETERMLAIDYVIDNYLFEYSKLHPESQITSKITDFRYWRDSPDYPYHRYDSRLTECLTLDYLSDESILECRAEKHPGRFSWKDYCLVKDDADAALNKCAASLLQASAITVEVKTNSHPYLGTGNHQLPIALRRSSLPLLSLDQARMLDVVDVRAVKGNSKRVRVTRGGDRSDDFYLPVERVHTGTHRNRELLSYYFAALRDQSPLARFRGFYNVLEYFFDEIEGGRELKTERERLGALLLSVTDAEQLRTAMTLAGVERDLTNDRTTANGERITALDLSTPNLVEQYSSRLYFIRNACVHSKRARRGRASARIVPYTDDENIVKTEVSLLQWLAVKCIEKEAAAPHTETE